MRRKVVIILAMAISTLLSVSCRMAEVAYISDMERDSAQAILTVYNETIHPGDKLYIYVFSQLPEGAIPFNQESRQMVLEMNRVNGLDGLSSIVRAKETYNWYGEKYIEGYTVHDDGNIIFPVLGKIAAADFTRDSLERYIEHLLISGGYLNDPIVTVSLMNSRVSVVGEVAKPQEIHIKGERLTIFEALAICGDMTIYGRRDNVVVVREKSGQVCVVEINLTSKSMFDSEAYYLQNNDIVYVQPTMDKERMLRRDEDWPHYISTTAHVMRWVIRLLRSYRRVNTVVD